MKLALHGRNLPSSATRTQGGFTLVELMVGLAMLLVVGGAAITAMIQLNRQAEIHRLYTIAAMAMQNQLQLCLTDTPYLPQDNEIPSELTTGTTLTPITLTSPGNPNDPNDFLVSGTMNTTVTSANSSLNVLQIAVSVTFSYRSKTYTVSANTMRTSDL